MKINKVIILGIGNVLFSDEGFGIRVVETLKERYDFDEKVSLIDGGVLGINLMGVISEADKLFVIDVIRNNGQPGDIYKINSKDIPDRIRAKNSLHQIDFLESLTLCQALDKTPETVIIGVEPKDIETLEPKLTKLIFGKINSVIYEILKELDKIDIKYNKLSKNKPMSEYWEIN